MASLLVRKEGTVYPSCIVSEQSEWGIRTVDIANPPRRFWADQEAPCPVVDSRIDSNRVIPQLSPCQLFQSLPENDNWHAQSRRSLARLNAYFLLSEDPQRRLEARAVSTLAHQTSLVQHILENDHLRRVMIADEVGLGKTVEAGLLIGQLLEQNPGLRVLYLAPARLVSNVYQEFDRLGLSFRQWSAIDGDARLSDARIIASIHRAVHPNNVKNILNVGTWDIIIVDECHHLSDWAAGGGDPKQKFKLVRDLVSRQQQGSRLVLLSGTPHQGHMSRFENLLNLMRADEEPPEKLSGRVIYRTKEDIRDWHGNPLFPLREVREPVIVDLGPEYRNWIRNIHDYFRPSAGSRQMPESRQRAAGWRCAQALQWAASSPQAGMGYLVRQAIRAGWGFDNTVLVEAMKSLRPYRAGKPDEPVENLFQRLLLEVNRQANEADLDDIEEYDDESDTSAREALEQLLLEGIQLLRTSADQKWITIKEKLLDEAGPEKVVLFAQPIETVTALAHFIERTMGERPALIIGGQSDRERQKEIDAFRRPDGPRFLVSSRAGGEGINLQVSRRLVHIDVPWNPMDLEQRVGRVHRFGSRKTILVDTVVVKDSREADAYRIARQKLRLIASTLVERERFEPIFSRVMCLVPPADLQDVLIKDSLAPFTQEDQEQIGRVVQEGFRAWNRFHERFSEQQKLVKQQDPGLATWQDLSRFLVEFGEVQPVSGFVAQRFVQQQGGVDAVDEAVEVLAFADGRRFVCGDTSGIPVIGPDGQSAAPLGLNIEPVAKKLREFAFAPATGAAHLRWKPDLPLPVSELQLPFGILVFSRQTVRTDPKAGYIELSLSLCPYLIISGQPPIRIEGVEKRRLYDGVLRATVVRSKPDAGDDLIQLMSVQESSLLPEMQRPSDAELRTGIRHAVTPVFAAVVVK